MALFHTINECPAVLVGIVNRVKKSGVSHFLLFQNRGIPLFCKRIGIQDLISTAGRCGERNQDIRLPECKNLHLPWRQSDQLPQISASADCQHIHTERNREFRSGTHPGSLFHRYGSPGIVLRALEEYCGPRRLLLRSPDFHRLQE